MPDPKMRPSFIIAAGILVLLLVVSVFGLTSLNLPFISPSGSGEIILLFVLSTIIFLGLVIFGFILFRSLLKLYLERRANQLGSKFKTKLVCGAVGLSVLPVFFLFLFSYSLINRTLDKWFSRPFETISRDAHDVVEVLEEFVQTKAAADAERLAEALNLPPETPDAAADLRQRFRTLPPPQGVDYLALLDPQGEVLLERRLQPEFPVATSFFDDREGWSGEGAAARLVHSGGRSYALARAPVALAERSGAAAIAVGIGLPARVTESAARLNQESVLYGELSRERKFLRQIYISILLLLTVLILFIATWFSLFLSRQITVPIQALAEATHEVSRGNLDFRVRTRAADELGILVRSFNEMTAQLSAGRKALEESRSHLEQMNLELDQRHRFTEAILESIPTGVISVSGKGVILASNTAARRIFGRDLGQTAHLSDLFSKEDVRELDYLMKRAARMGQASRSIEVNLNGQAFHLAITVSALPGESPGASQHPAGSGWFVVVLEDMSELLRAQKQAAWGEVAQRVAHEIKNPLTPIALSAERIHLWLERQSGLRPESAEFSRVIQESCALIREEVENLKRLVDEFSQFARFPTARPAPANLNQIVESALGLFNGRLDGIRIRTQLSPDLPTVSLDADQFRRVLVNLIDNAAEAMETSLVKELVIATRTDSRREVVEAEVSDTGCGVSPEDREKLFLPYFSTKDRGTGLGLAIVSRIVAEHSGAVRVEENHPMGTRFVVELPISVSETSRTVEV